MTTPINPLEIPFNITLSKFCLFLEQSKTPTRIGTKVHSYVYLNSHHGPDHDLVKREADDLWNLICELLLHGNHLSEAYKVTFFQYLDNLYRLPPF